MRKLKSCLFLIPALILNTIIASLVWYYRNDIYIQERSYHVLEQRGSYDSDGDWNFGKIVLVSNTPRIQNNIAQTIEYHFETIARELSAFQAIDNVYLFDY